MDEDEFRQACAEDKLSGAKLGRLAILEYLERRKINAWSVKPGEDVAQRQARFVLALEDNWTMGRTCQKTGVSRVEAKGWMQDQVFAARVNEAQMIFVEKVEWRMIRMGMCKKGQLLAIQTFLNAHHPQHGRLKYEAVIRWFGPLQEAIYTLIRADLGEKAGETLCKKIRELADKALSKLTD